MKLFVNLDPLLPPLTGIGQYTYGILSELVEHEGLEDLYGQYLGRWYERDDIRQLLAKSLVATSSKPRLKVGINWPRLFATIPGVRPLYHGIKQWRLMQKIHQNALADTVYWEPNYVLRSFPGLSVPTIHDIAYIRRPEFHEQSTIDRLTHQVPESIAKAAHIFTVSQLSRQEIMEHYRLPADLMSVVYPGVSAAFYPHSEDEKSKMRQRYQLPENFILSLGTLEPRKNLKGLMQAYLQLPDVLRHDFPLVLVGTKGWLMDQFSQELAQLEAQGQLIRLGYVQQSDLPALMSAATVMAYVSHYEGFGMPVAEAMASGTAVLTSQGTSMEEVACGAARLVNPADIDDIAQGLSDLLMDEALRVECEKKGLLAVKRYSWRSSADQLLSALIQCKIKQNKTKDGSL
jgi:alpha-1,3-rhamnosyl/mannosyltransferase